MVSKIELKSEKLLFAPNIGVGTYRFKMLRMIIFQNRYFYGS